MSLFAIWFWLSVTNVVWEFLFKKRGERNWSAVCRECSAFVAALFAVYLNGYHQ